MQSSGDTFNPMRIAIIYRLFHIILCPFLVFGWWIFPRLETSGAAYTGIISACLGAGIGLWFLTGGRTRLKLNFKGFKPDFVMIWRVIRIGVPASITGMQKSLAQVIMTAFVSPFGTMAVAAHSLTQQVDQFVYIAGSGIGQASGILAGMNIGGGKPDRAEKSGWLGAALYTSIMGVGSIALWFWGSYTIKIFNSDPEVVAIGTGFVRIQIITYMVSGFANVLQTCLNSVGDTLAPMVVVLVSMFVVQVPLGYLLSQHTGLGVYGTRWAIAIGTVIMGAIYAGYFKLGLWKRRRV